MLEAGITSMVSPARSSHRAKEGMMPSKTCLKCGHVNQDFKGTPDAECPNCGAIYAKVEKAQANTRLRQPPPHAPDPAPTTETAPTGTLSQPSEFRSDRPIRGIICAACGAPDAVKRQAKGSFGLELTLWLIGLVTIPFGIGVIILIVALIYSLWRMFAGRSRVCSSCGSSSLIRADSPRGRAMLKELGLGPQDFRGGFLLPGTSLMPILIIVLVVIAAIGVMMVEA
jgi:ssDNA-binding Zn-finger/Zn-ribbon topoisomerase 1